MAHRIAHPLAHAFSQVWAPVRRNDANVVNLLGLDGHVPLALYDMQIAVVPRWKQRRSNIGASHAASLQGAVLRAVELMPLRCGCARGTPVAVFRRERRNGPLRSYDQRGSRVPVEL